MGNVKFFTVDIGAKPCALIILALDIIGLYTPLGMVFLLISVFALFAIIVKQHPKVLLIYILIKIVYALLLGLIGVGVFLGYIYTITNITNDPLALMIIIYGLLQIYFAWVFNRCRMVLIDEHLISDVPNSSDPVPLPTKDPSKDAKVDPAAAPKKN